MPSRSSSDSTFSVIGPDVKIRGDIAASADIHIDGAVEGDIACSSLVQGESSTICGGVEAESARLSGTVKGSISVRELVILKSARIDGDVSYDALTIEQGAQVEGRFAPRGTNAAQPSGQGTTKTEGKPETKPDVKPDDGEPKLSLAG